MRAAPQLSAAEAVPHTLCSRAQKPALLSGVQTGTHWLPVLQAVPAVHMPHEPPHPSAPHCLPTQAGAHWH